MLAVENTIVLALYVVALGLAVWALADALFRPAAYYPAAGKLTKPVWSAILVVAVLVIAAFGFMGIFGIAAVIASIVYLVDVRLALRALKPGNNPWA